MEDVQQLKEHIEKLLFVVKYEAEDKISRSVVSHFLKDIILKLDQIEVKDGGKQI